MFLSLSGGLYNKERDREKKQEESGDEMLTNSFKRPYCTTIGTYENGPGGGTDDKKN